MIQQRPQNCGTSYCSCIECVMEPEPVAEIHSSTLRWIALEENRPTNALLYTTPPQRKPLTDEEILHFVDTHVGAPSMAYPLDNSDWMNFARAIEAAHGIKE